MASAFAIPESAFAIPESGIAQRTVALLRQGKKNAPGRLTSRERHLFRLLPARLAQRLEASRLRSAGLGFWVQNHSGTAASRLFTFASGVVRLNSRVMLRRCSPSAAMASMG